MCLITGKCAGALPYVDDVVEGIVRVIERRPRPNPEWSGDRPDPSSSSAPYQIYNIGNGTGVELGHFISLLEKLLGKQAVRNELPLQPGDVLDNSADVDDLVRDVDFRPSTPLEVGLERFVSWYREYYGD